MMTINLQARSVLSGIRYRRQYAWVANNKARIKGRESQPHRRIRRTLRARARRAKHPERVMLAAAKQRARIFGLPFDLVATDIHIPLVCPVFGIKLEPSTKGQPLASSPSLDRIVPALGYVRGNVRVISHKANTIKSNATVSELRAVLRYLETADVTL